MRDETYVGSSDVLLPFLLGAATGAALALLYAPYSGRQTRELIKDGIARGTERTKEIRDRVVGRGREILDQASDAVERGRERLGAAVEAGREAFREEKAAMTGSMPSRS